jgi:hypothetical protein
VLGAIWFEWKINSSHHVTSIDMHENPSLKHGFSVPLATLVAEGDKWLRGDGLRLNQVNDALPLKEVCQILHTYDVVNEHLAMPMGKHSTRHPDRRGIPLDPDVPVYGTFLSLDFHHHDGYYVLRHYETQTDLADWICGPAGVCNDYVAFMIAFHEGTCLPYRIRYTDLNGQRKLLDKKHPETVPEDWDWETDEYRNIEIEWQSCISKR